MIEPTYSSQSSPTTTSGSATNLGDILERVLDRGLVITGDIRVSLLDIELLTIKLRLLIASVDTARAIGINWWENDPWLTNQDSLREENKRLRERLEALESGEDAPALEEGDEAEGDEAEGEGADDPDREESRAAEPRRRSR